MQELWDQIRRLSIAIRPLLGERHRAGVALLVLRFGFWRALLFVFVCWSDILSAWWKGELPEC